MPALRGSLTYARFFVEGSVPGDHRDRFVKAIRLRAMRPLEPDDEDLERSGWTKIGEPYATELAHEDVFHDDAYVNLGFRTDRWVLPAQVLKRNLGEAEAAYLQKKGRERLTRREKSELKLLVAKRLRKSYAPQTRIVDVSWSLDEGVVRFFSHAAKAGASMTELFTKTFGLALVPESPYTLAARLGLDAEEEQSWNALEAIELGSDAHLAFAAEEE